MDLSFALGLPLSEIFRLPESHLRIYAAYAAQFGLPTQRLELYAAQQSYMIARTMGGYKGKLSHFLLRENESDEDNSDDVFADFSPDY